MGEALITRRGGGGGYKTGDTVSTENLEPIFSEPTAENYKIESANVAVSNKDSAFACAVAISNSIVAYVESYSSAYLRFFDMNSGKSNSQISLSSVGSSIKQMVFDGDDSIYILSSKCKLGKVSVSAKSLVWSVSLPSFVGESESNYSGGTLCVYNGMIYVAGNRSSSYPNIDLFSVLPSGAYSKVKRTALYNEAYGIYVSGNRLLVVSCHSTENEGDMTIDYFNLTTLNKIETVTAYYPVEQVYFYKNVFYTIHTDQSSDYAYLCKYNASTGALIVDAVYGGLYNAPSIYLAGIWDNILILTREEDGADVLFIDSNLSNETDLNNMYGELAFDGVYGNGFTTSTAFELPTITRITGEITGYQVLKV